MSAMIANDGEEAAKAWAEGLLANLARPPEGGDTDQLKAVVSGACDIAVANTYYFARGLATRSTGSARASTTSAGSSRTRTTTGTHVNIAAAGVAAHAPHPDAAITFLEYLSTPEAQAYFADQNYEYPAAADAEVGRGPGLARHLQERHPEPQRARREPAEGAGDLQRDRLPLGGDDREEGAALAAAPTAQKMKHRRRGLAQRHVFEHDGVVAEPQMGIGPKLARARLAARRRSLPPCAREVDPVARRRMKSVIRSKPELGLG